MPRAKRSAVAVADRSHLGRKAKSIALAKYEVDSRKRRKTQELDSPQNKSAVATEPVRAVAKKNAAYAHEAKKIVKPKAEGLVVDPTNDKAGTEAQEAEASVAADADVAAPAVAEAAAADDAASAAEESAEHHSAPCTPVNACATSPSTPPKKPVYKMVDVAGAPATQHGSAAASSAGVAAGLFSPVEALPEECNELLTKIGEVLKRGCAARRLWPAFLNLLDNPVLASPRPFVASMVRQATSLWMQDGCAKTVRPDDLHCLIAILEVLALKADWCVLHVPGSKNADYVDDCLVAAVKLCLFSLSEAGLKAETARKGGFDGTRACQEWLDVGGRAANFLAALIRFHAAARPSLPKQIVATFKDQMSQKSVACDGSEATCIAEVLHELLHGSGSDPATQLQALLSRSATNWKLRDKKSSVLYRK